MAKKDEFDLGSEFEDFESDISGLDFGDITVTDSDSNRSPIEKVRNGVTSGLKSATSNLGPKLATRIDEKLPKTGSLVGEAMRFTSDAMAVRDKFQREMTPAINQTKRAARILAPKVTKYLPKKAQDRIDKLLAESDKWKAPSVEEAREASINESLSLIFAAQTKAQIAQSDEDRTQKYVDRTISATRHQELSQVVDAIRVNTEFQKNFIQSIGIGYLKQSLKLKYEHLFVAQDTLATVQGIANVLESKLDQIRHNTALPDIQKQKLSESYKEVMRGAVSARVNVLASNWGKRILKNIQDRVLDPIKNNADMIANGLDMYASISQSMDSIPGSEESGSTKLGRFAGGMLAGKLASKATSYLLGNETTKGLISPYGRNIEDFATQAKLRLMLKVKDLEENADPSSVSGMLLNLLSPGVSRGAGYVGNDTQELYEPVSYDKAARTSIVEIIPGYLARILQQATMIATGQPAEELTYDYTKRDFTSVSAFRSRVIEEAFGDRDSRGSMVGQATGSVRGAFAHAGGKIDTFDKITDKISRVLVNSATAKYPIYPEHIKNFAEGMDLSDAARSYISAVFKNIDDAKAVAQVFVTALYRDDTAINQQALTEINRYVFGLMGRDDYLDILPKYLIHSGQSRHLKGLFEDVDASGFNFDREAIRDLYLGGDRMAFVEGLLDTSGGVKRRLDEDILEKMKVPEETRNLLERLSGSATKTQINKTDISKFKGKLKSSKGKAFGSSQNLPEILQRTPTQYVTETTPGQYQLPILDVNIVGSAIDVPVHLRTSDVDSFGQENGPEVETETHSDQLSDIFRSHAERQHPVPDLLEKIAGSSSEMNDKLLSLIANTQSFFGNMKHKGKSFTKGMFDALLKLKTSGSVSYLKEKGAGALAYGLGQMQNLRDRYKEFGLSGIPYLGGAFSLASNIGGNIAGAGLTAYDYMKGLMTGARGRTVGGFSRAKDSIQDWMASLKEKNAERIEKFKSGVGSFGKKIKAATKMHWRFVDVYKKDNVDPGNNVLLTKRKQEEGVVFANGRSVITSYDIREPVLDPATGDTLISKQDIEHGLVDVYNKPLLKKSGLTGFLKKGMDRIGGKFGTLKDVLTGKNPIMNLVTKFLGTGIDLAGLAGKGLFGLFSKATGIDKLTIRRGDLKTLVADKLDKIYKLLDERISGGPSRAAGDEAPGDMDGDGKRDTAFEEFGRKLTDRAKKKSELLAEKSATTLSKIKDTLEKQVTLTKESIKVQKENGDGKGGILSRILEAFGLGAGAKGIGGILRGIGTKALGLFSLGGGAAAVAGGGAAAGTAAAGATAGAATAGTAAATGGGLLASLSGAGAATTAALASNPIGWGIAGAIAVGAVGYAGYKWLNPSGDSLIETRAKMYGIDLSTSTGIFGESYTKKLIALEEETAEILEQSSSPMRDKDLESWAKRFGFNPKNEKEVSYWVTWYRQRFFPTFRIFLDLVKKAGHNYGSVDDLSEETGKEIADIFVKQVKPHVDNLRDLTPDVKGYQKFQRILDKQKDSESKPYTAEEQAKVDEERDANSATTRYSKKYGVRRDMNRAAREMSEGSETESPGDKKTQQKKGFWANLFSGFGSTTKEAVKDFAPIDTSGYKPELPKSGELGALSAKFESATAGSVAIGYDPTGGTSYGKYQIASNTGTFERFLRWVATQGGEGAEIARRLREAGPPNTGGRDGAVPNEWKRLVVEGKMKDYEHQFIKASHYEPALMGLSSTVRQMVEGSKALQDVLWSTAVQHGPAGASKIFNAAYLQLGDNPTVEQLIRVIYSRRGGGFPSSPANVQASVKKRFGQEAAIALAMAAKEKGGKTEGTEATSEGTATADGSAGASATPAEETPNTPTVEKTTENGTVAPSTAATPEPTPPSTTPQQTQTPTQTQQTQAAPPKTEETAATSDQSQIDILKTMTDTLVQINQGVQSLASGQGVFAEIRDGITNGFASMTSAQSSSASGQPAGANRPRPSASTTAQPPAVSVSRAQAAH